MNKGLLWKFKKAFSKRFKGKRIRPLDKNLVLNTLTLIALTFFLALYSMMNFEFLTSLKGFNVLAIAYKFGAYQLYTFLASALLSAFSTVCIYVVFIDYFQKLKHRQLLCKLILDNGYYTTIDTSKEFQAIKDLPFDSKKRINYFPKMYYRSFKGLIYIQVEIEMNQFQEQLFSLDKKLETGFSCEVVNQSYDDGVRCFVLKDKVIRDRITIDEAVMKNGELTLMKNFKWDIDRLPHGLIVGGTGSGKTYFILTLIECFLKGNAHITVLDPKRSDLSDLANVMDNVYFKKEDMVECINSFCEEMMRRPDEMKLMKGYVTGENYAYMGLEPHFLIFDEYVAFMEMLGTREREQVLSKLKQIIMMGRQAGYFLIIACQRADSKYFDGGMRDQFNFRLALGRNSDIGYSMMFGETSKKFYLKNIKGRGYVDDSSGVIKEFYAPVVPYNHDFLGEIGKLYSRLRG